MIQAQIIGSKLPSCSYFTTSAQGPFTTSVVTFAGQSIGQSKPSRVVVVGIAYLSAAAVASVMVGGISATFLARAGTVGNQPVELWAALVPTGTTATIVVTYAGSTSQRTSISVWSIYDLRTQSPIATAVSVSSPGTVTVASQPKGIVVSLATTNQNSVTFTWSEAGEDYETSVTSGGVITRSGFHTTTTAMATSLTVTYSSSFTPAVVAAAWR
jgi:hypothetical protein